MTTYLVTRHKGAFEWVQRQGIQIDFVTNHLEPETIEMLGVDDAVVGTLPIQLVAAVCHVGATYFHLSLDIPQDLRGQELSAEMMEEHGARLERYFVQKHD